jgi:hypothetical protein
MPVTGCWLAIGYQYLSPKKVQLMKNPNLDLKKKNMRNERAKPTSLDSGDKA